MQKIVLPYNYNLMKRALLFLLCAVMSVQIFSTVDISAELFPTLAGLQRTVCNEYCGEEDDNSANFTYKQTFDSIFFENDKPYILCNGYLLREEDNKIFLYSQSLNKDIVLYDFTLEVGDSLPAYIKDFDGTMYSDDTLVVTDISSVTLLDGKEYKKWTFDNGMEYVEGIGMYGGHRNGNFFGLIQEIVVPCHTGTHLVCVSKNGQLLYQMDDTEMERLGAECLCEYNAEQKPKDLFPTLWGLQRTTCLKNINENEVGTVWGSNSYLMQEIETTTIDGKQYLLFGTNNTYDEYWSLWLREENNKILVYSAAQKKDLVLYDFTLNVGDSLPRLYVDEELSSIVDYFKYEADWEYTKPLFVTEVSTITLLDGKEYKKWTFDNGIEYVEGIGSFGTSYAWNDFYQLIANGPLYSDVFSQHLVCASKNGQLLYKMDEAEMEQLETECLCEIEPKWSETWCDTWNVLSHGWDPEGGDDPYMPYTFIYQLEEDTTINDLTYQRLTGRFSLSTMPSNKEYVAALRFSENKKVFIHYDDTEYLLYDFGAQVGDTLEIFGGINYYKDFKTLPHVITEIDTLDDGRLQIYSNAIIQESEGYETPFERLYPKIWIEGVGSKDGIVQNSATNRIGIGPCVLLCAYHNDECIYTTDNPYYTSLGCVYNDPIFSATEEVNAPTQSAQKIMYNGQLLILRDSKTYNVMGMEVTK